MLHRFERGGKYTRIQHPDKGPFEDTVWYDISGPTIVATNKVINEILETSRSPDSYAGNRENI